MNTVKFLPALAILFLLASCSKKINPERPVLGLTNFKLDSLPVSEINIPIRINLRPFYGMAERQVDTMFTSPNYPNEWVQNGCDTRYKYTFRRSPFQLKAGGNKFNLGFTGYYRIIGSTRVCVAGAALSSWTSPCRCGFDEPERRVNVSFTSTFGVQPDYKVRLNITRDEPKALDKCEVCFWGQDITNQVLKGLKTELDTARAAMMRSYGTVNLRPQFQQVWNQLSKVYNIYNKGWLQINPERLQINNLYAQNDSLYLNLGLMARPVVSFEKPVEQLREIPDMAGNSRLQGFSVFLDATLNYDSLSTLMNQHLVGQSYNFKKGPVNKKFVIRQCRLSGMGNEKLIIRVDFGGSNEGTIYLTGKPTYDASRHLLEIKDIDFDIRSRNALLSTAEWMFNKRIIHEIEKQSRFDLTAFIDSAKVNLDQQLNQEWVKGISCEGAINDIQLIGIYPMGQSLVIRSNCSGRLSVKVDAVDFSL